VFVSAQLCKAKSRGSDHNNINHLERILQWADARAAGAERGARQARVPVVTESVFSMDGDRAPLREILELKERYGAWLLVDEAHATGLYGEQRRGLAEQLGVSDRIE